MEKIDLNSKLLKLLREDRDFRDAVLGLLGLQRILKSIAEHIKAIKELQKEVAKNIRATYALQEQVAENTKAVVRLDRTVTVLNARWGILSEDAFRLGLRGIIERHFGGRIPRCQFYDERGVLYGTPYS